MNDVVIDTNVVIWYFGQPMLSSGPAQVALESALLNGSIFVTTITIVELKYLIEKKRIPADVLVALQNALDEPSSAIRSIDLTREISEAVSKIPRTLVSDMPDRIIAATAFHLDLPLITSDSNIHKLTIIETIW